MLATEWKTIMTLAHHASLTLLVTCFLNQQPQMCSAVNLALNKMAYQITTFTGYTAARAVDGNKNTNLNAGSCSHTDGTVPNPWWAVDLGQRYTVSGVNVTMRGDWLADTRLNYFIVGLTNIQPRPGQQISLYNYTLCGQYPKTVSPGTTVYQSCFSTQQQYRYVIIQTNSTLTRDKYMDICEVEVYGLAERGTVVPHWLRVHTDTSLALLLENCIRSRSAIECAQLCGNVDGCVVFQYGTDKRQCCPVANASNPIGPFHSHPGWDVWMKK